MNIQRQIRGLAYQAFYGLPLPIRRQIARLVSPKYLVGAVTVVRDSESPDRILLLRQPPGRGWGLPAGLLKARELPAVGAARELFEEAGVRVEPTHLTAGNPNAIVHPNGGVVDTVWFASVPASSTPLVVDGGEVLEAQWFAVTDLPKLTWPTERLLGIYGIGPRSGELPPSLPAGTYQASFPDNSASIPSSSATGPSGSSSPAPDSSATGSAATGSAATASSARDSSVPGSSTTGPSVPGSSVPGDHSSIPGGRSSATGDAQ